MSAKISGKCWELKLDPMDKLVLLALADHADHEGNNVRPGNELLCAKTGLSERTIGIKIKKLESDGLVTFESGGRGRGKIRELSIDPDGGERHPHFIERDRRKAEAASTLLNGKSRSSFDKSKSLKVEDDDTKSRTSGSEKSKMTTLKVEDDGSAYKEENRHEPSIEPSGESARATEIFKMVFGRELSIFQQEQLGIVDDFATWRQTLLDWQLNAYSQKNLAGMIESYKANRLKAAKNSNGMVGYYPAAADKSKPAPAVDLSLAEEGFESLPESLLEALRRTVTESALNTWFLPLKIGGGPDATLRLLAPSPVFEEWITNNYRDAFSDALTSAGYDFERVEFICRNGGKK